MYCKCNAILVHDSFMYNITVILFLFMICLNITVTLFLLICQSITVKHVVQCTISVLDLSGYYCNTISVHDMSEYYYFCCR